MATAVATAVDVAPPLNEDALLEARSKAVIAAAREGLSPALAKKYVRLQSGRYAELDEAEAAAVKAFEEALPPAPAIHPAKAHTLGVGCRGRAPCMKCMVVTGHCPCDIVNNCLNGLMDLQDASPAMLRTAAEMRGVTVDELLEQHAATIAAKWEVRESFDKTIPRYEWSQTGSCVTVRLYLDYGGGEDLRREHVDASFGPQSLRLTISLPRKRTYSFAIHALHAGIVPEECGFKVSSSRGRVALKLRKLDAHYVWPKLDKLDGQLNALARPSPTPYLPF
eukprot:PRCOL_00002768-RA